jgi:hypothetical protein
MKFITQTNSVLEAQRLSSRNLYGYFRFYELIFLRLGSRGQPNHEE